MIQTQRAYEINSKAIQTSDQMLQPSVASCDQRRAALRNPAGRDLARAGAGRLLRSSLPPPNVAGRRADDGAAEHSGRAAAATVANGAIYPVADASPAVVRGPRAPALVGDTLTVVHQGEDFRQAESSTSLDRKSAVDARISALPLISAWTRFTRASVKVAARRIRWRQGRRASDNTFTGTITVTVVEVLPNGNLVVAARSRSASTRAPSLLRFSGVVNPTTIQAGNPSVDAGRRCPHASPRHGRHRPGADDGLASRFFLAGGRSDAAADRSWSRDAR